MISHKELEEYLLSQPNARLNYPLVAMGVLVPLKSGEGVYAQKWVYKNYLDLFDSNN